MQLKKIFLLVCLFLTSISVFSQRRQADSLKQRQIDYNQKVLRDAQKKKEEEARYKATHPTVVTSYDSKGNKVESYKSLDGERVTTTIIKLPSALNRPFLADTLDKDSITIKVYKSKYRMQVYHKGKILTMYKCVFGPYHLMQKQQEGDRRTPEGTFTILDIKKHEKWDIFMLLDYPNDESKMNFEKCKLNREISDNARIGGAVGIHGIWANGDNVIDMKHNWTDGCIALKNKDVEELSKIIKAGVTKIVILR